jgi:hypothetical protein
VFIFFAILVPFIVHDTGAQGVGGGGYPPCCKGVRGVALEKKIGGFLRPFLVVFGTWFSSMVF